MVCLLVGGRLALEQIEQFGIVSRGSLDGSACILAGFPLQAVHQGIKVEGVDGAVDPDEPQRDVVTVDERDIVLERDVSWPVARKGVFWHLGDECTLILAFSLEPLSETLGAWRQPRSKTCALDS